MRKRTKKQKMSIEPVLQDFSITSLTDINQDIMPPSDYSVLQQIVGYDAALPDLTLNNTEDVSLSSGPYPPDSTMEDVTKQKLPTSLFKVPFLKKGKKKPIPNVFDSVLNDSEPDTPEPIVRRPFQRKRTVLINSNIFDINTSNDSINKSPAVTNFIKRRLTRAKKNVENSFFDKDIVSSESDESFASRQVLYRRRTNDNKNISTLFDDVFNETFNNSQANKSVPKLLPFENIKRRQTYINPTMFDSDLNSSGSFQQSLECSSNTDQHNCTNDNESKENCEIYEVNHENVPGFEIQSLNIENKCTSETSEFISEEAISHNKVETILDIFEKDQTAENLETVDIETVNGFRSKHYSENKNSSLIDGPKAMGNSIQTSFSLQSDLRNGVDILVDGADINSNKRDNQKEEMSNKDINCISFENNTGLEIGTNSENISVTTDSLNIHASEEINASENFKEEKSNTNNLLVKNKPQDDSENLFTKNIQHLISDECNTSDNCAITNEYKLHNVEVSTEACLELSRGSNLREIDVQSRSREKESRSDQGNIILPTEKHLENIQSKPKTSTIISNESNVKGSINPGNISQNKIADSIQNNSIPSTKTTKVQNQKLAIITPHKKEKRVSFNLKNGLSYEERNPSRRKSSRRSVVDNSHCKERSSTLTNNQSSYNKSGFSIDSLVCPDRSERTNSESEFIDLDSSKCKITSESTSTTSSNSSGNQQTKEFSSNEKTSFERTGGSLKYNEKTIVDKNQDSFFAEEKTDESITMDDTCVEEDQEGSSLKYNKKSIGDENQDNLSAEEKNDESIATDDTCIEEEQSVEYDEMIEEEITTKGSLEQEDDEEDSDKELNESLENEVANSIGNGGDCDEQILIRKEKSNKFQKLNEKSSLGVEGTFKKPNDVITNTSKTRLKVNSKSHLKFKEPPVPLSKGEIKQFLNNIPLSEFKKKRKRSVVLDLTREQMQQDEIEEALRKRLRPGRAPKKTSSTSRLKKPKKWVTSKFYNFIINKLKPNYGIRSRVQAEHVVVFIVDCVEQILKKDNGYFEVVEEMKSELAHFGVVKTHYDFNKLVSTYFDGPFVYKVLLGKIDNPFEPDNVCNDII